jgi:hypothetical protein
MRAPPSPPTTWDQTAFVVFPGASTARPAHTICERPCHSKEVGDILRLWDTPVAYRTDHGDTLFWWPNGELRLLKADGTDYKFPAKLDVGSMPWTAAQLPSGAIIDYTGPHAIYWGTEKEASRQPETPYSYLVSVEGIGGWEFVPAHTFEGEELDQPPFQRFGCSRFVRRPLRPVVGQISAPQANDPCPPEAGTHLGRGTGEKSLQSRDV